MSRKKDHEQLITDRPSFEELAELRENALEVVNAIRALAEEEDVIQRATDLLEISKNLQKNVKSLVIQQD